ncbi:PQQ-binding-like beta-propeller repeat protein [Haloglomus litoreum]|uniref:outer membrane protein assembly factor BamB family protein n=1 Tax=Haloglomus litoreum TaxID=3034026 RepID=UPI0023E7A5A8|nr:PQQ-binding-like beta-propeller repeat protein [Haloglomus sp. DT116]
MVSRRRLLQVGAGTLAAAAGCTDTTDNPPADAGPSDQPSPTDAGDGPTTTPDGDLDAWEPAWTLSFDHDVLGVDAGENHLFLTVSANDGPSAVVAVDPAEQSIVWRTESEGEAVAASHAAARPIARGHWGATVTARSVYTVAGPAEEREWTALHALDRATGDRRWSVRRDRRFSVAGVTDGLLVATGQEFVDRGTPAHPTPTPERTSTVVYGIDAADGSVRWTREFVAVGAPDVALSSDGIFVATGDRLVGLDHQGSTTFTLDHGPATRVEAVPGRVYYLSGDPYEGGPQTLHGVSPDGTRAWAHDLAVHELLLDGDRLYAGGDVVVAVDPDGTVAWQDGDYGEWLLLDPDGDTLYTRSGVQADAATAYDTAGEARWTFDPPANNAWPEAATADALMVDTVSGPTYLVDAEGEATATLERETIFDALGLDGTMFVADGRNQLLALDP